MADPVGLEVSCVRRALRCYVQEEGLRILVLLSFPLGSRSRGSPKIDANILKILDVIAAPIRPLIFGHGSEPVPNYVCLRG